MARRDIDIVANAKRAKFLGLVAFLRILKSFLFLCVEVQNDIRKTLKNANLSKIKAFFAKLA